MSEKDRVLECNAKERLCSARIVLPVDGQNSLKQSSKDRRRSLFSSLALRFSPKESPSRCTRMLIRRYSSPILPTKLSMDSKVEDANWEDIDDVDNGEINVISNLGKRRLRVEDELVSRSFSLRLGDGDDAFESFCPSDFEIKELLGKGFFGEVYKVVHCKTGQTMVLKRLYRINSRCEQDFVKEAAVMRRLHHPNVLRFMGILYKDRQLHLITEYVSGGTLRHWLDSTGVLPWKDRVSVSKDVASGMTYLHSKNIIHRDLNSGNILIREEDSSAVVADFGLARIVCHRRFEKRRRLTVVGNPYLMAPEMSKEQLYNELVDVFSYGITLCEIIGRCSSDPDILHRRKDFGIDHQRFISQFVSDSCPRDFLDLAFECAAVSPHERPAFETIERRLDTLLEELLSREETVDDEVSKDTANSGNIIDVVVPTGKLPTVRKYWGVLKRQWASTSVWYTSDTSIDDMDTCANASHTNHVHSRGRSSRDREESSRLQDPAGQIWYEWWYWKSEIRIR